jgi:hypothetical protein
MAAALLNTLPMPSTNRVDWVYRQLKDILGVAAEQQAKSSLQQWVEVSVSSPGRSKASRQRTASELPVAGTVSSPTRAPTRLQPGHPSGHPEPQACYKAHRGGRGRVLSTACITHAVVGVTIKKGTVSTLKGQGPRHWGATWVTRVSLSTFRFQIMSLCMMAKPILVFG